MKLRGILIFTIGAVSLGLTFCNVSPGRPASTYMETPSPNPTSEIPHDTTLVVEGSSVGPIGLGNTFDQVVEILPVRENYDEVHDKSSFKSPDGAVISCSKVLYRNSVGGKDDVDLAVYFDDGDRVVQIEGKSPRFHLQNGVSYHADLNDVVNKYKNAKRYSLNGSGAGVAGDKDLVFLVDESQGIAFHFQYSRQKKGMELEFFNVFRPLSHFLPQTCVTPPQKWELKTKE